MKAPRGIQTPVYPIAGSLVAAQDVRVDTVRSSMDGVHPDLPDSVIPCAVKDDPVSVLQSFAAQDDSRSAVKVLNEGPSVTKNWSWTTKQVHLYWFVALQT